MVEHRIRRIGYLERFECLGAECEDTCCKQWSMQVDAATHEKYQREAPELLDAVEEGPGTLIMRKDPATSYCVKLEGGWCGIHKKYGSGFLGDACHFYPRVTRRIGNETVMTAALSCPEIVRLSLYTDDVFGWQAAEVERLPYTMKDYTPEGLAGEAALEVHRAFLDAALDKSAAPERSMARIVSVAQSLGAIDKASWPAAVPFYLKSADARLIAPEPAPADPFNLLHALMGIIVAAKAQNRERLRETVADMEWALQVHLDWEALGIRMTGSSESAFMQMQADWEERYGEAFAPVLRRWIAAELSIALFPFAGFGNTVTERAFLLGVRFATVRLALMCACHAAGRLIEEAQQVRIIQSLARVLDHLADPELSLQIYAEPGWLREGRLRALMGDIN